MHLTSERKRATGAFYTPYTWAKKAVEYMARTFPHPLHHYVFYDPAGGEGALLECLPPECVSVATTLEAEDVEIMRSKGIDAYQFDFLDDDLDQLPSIILNAAKMERLVVFTNPPYFKLKGDHKCYTKTKYGCNDSVMLFYYRIYQEIMPQYLCAFNKLDILMPGDTMKPHCNEIISTSKCLGGFLSPSKSWGLSGKFPIAFNMFELTDMLGYYGGLNDLMNGGYHWSLDIFNAKGQRKPYQKPSIEATALTDNDLEEVDGLLQIKPEALPRLNRIKEASERYERSWRLRFKESQLLNISKDEKEHQKKSKHRKSSATRKKPQAVQLAFEF